MAFIFGCSLSLLHFLVYRLIWVRGNNHDWNCLSVYSVKFPIFAIYSKFANIGFKLGFNFVLILFLHALTHSNNMTQNYSLPFKWTLYFQCKKLIQIGYAHCKVFLLPHQHTYKISSHSLLTGVRIYILMALMQSVWDLFSCFPFHSTNMCRCGYRVKASKWCVWLPYNNERSKWVHNPTLLFFLGYCDSFFPPILFFYLNCNLNLTLIPNRWTTKVDGIT